MKFSMMTYTLMRQKTYTPADCIRVAVELGMDGIDWVSTYGEDPRELRKRCDDAGLPVVAHTFFLHRVPEAELLDKAAVNLDNAVALGAPVVMLPPPPSARNSTRRRTAAAGRNCSSRSPRSPRSAASSSRSKTSRARTARSSPRTTSTSSKRWCPS